MRNDRFGIMFIYFMFALFMLFGAGGTWVGQAVAAIFVLGAVPHWVKRNEPFSKEELESMRKAPSGG